jgi:hypothetical protein
MTNTKNFFASIAAVLLVACAMIAAPPASAQSTSSSLIVTATKLAAALTQSATMLTVSSATSITANNTILFIEDGSGGNSEAVFVNSVSGTAIGVTRGYNGTAANPHLSGSVVLAGPAGGGPFVSVEPSGSCTAASSWTPTVNILTGNQWICSSISASWVPGFFNDAAPAGVTTAVASVAGATNPSGPLFHVSGTNAITAWGSSTSVGPGTGQGGGASTQPYGAPFCVIPDAAFTWTATNNIATAGTAVLSLEVCFTFDGTNKKYIQMQSK